jgi:hypothetical protein
MQHATGPWVEPPTLPEDPKRLCLVELRNERSGATTYYAMRYLRGNWQFQDRLRLSGEQRVVRWALILESAPAAVPL